MFDKSRFAELLNEAKGEMSINEYARYTNVSGAHISRLIRELINTPPTPQTLKKLSRYPLNKSLYIGLMSACGYEVDESLIKERVTSILPLLQNKIDEAHETLRNNPTKQNIGYIKGLMDALEIAVDILGEDNEN